MIVINVISNKFSILIGNKYFHSKFNSWSIRNLGNVQRNHMMTNMRKNTFPMNHTDDGI